MAETYKTITDKEIKGIVNAALKGVLSDSTANVCFMKLQTELLAVACDGLDIITKQNKAIADKLDTLVMAVLSGGKT